MTNKEFDHGFIILAILEGMIVLTALGLGAGVIHSVIERLASPL